MYVDKFIQITDTEWHIMNIVWSRSPLFMSEIVAELKHTSWKKTTIQTMVSRLITKKIIGVNRTGRAFTYFPIISEKEATRMKTNYFIKNICKGNAVRCVERIVEIMMISAEEKKSIKKLLSD